MQMTHDDAAQRIDSFRDLLLEGFSDYMGKYGEMPACFPFGHPDYEPMDFEN